MVMGASQIQQGPALTPADDAPHLLVVDDDERIRNLLSDYLREHGFRVSTAEDAETARAALRGIAFDLLILDVMMPGESGLSLARSLRKERPIPILMLTALSEPKHRVLGLELGVDDYLSKPFEPRELLLRLHNILKRQALEDDAPEVVYFGDCVFHIGRGELRRGAEPIRLTDRERALLRQLAASPGVPIERHELAGSDGEDQPSDRAVDVQINRLRRKIEADPANPVFLQTVRGRGYVLHIDR